jgi:hypothetical protein
MLLSIGLILLFLVACSQLKQNSDPAVGPAKLTQQQKNLLAALNPDSLFVFDLTQMSEDMRFVKFWIEYYNKGQKRENIAEGMSEMNGDKMTVVFAKQSFSLENEQYESWRIALVDQPGFTSFESNPLKMNGVGKFRMSTQLEEKIPITLNKPLILAMAINSNNHSISVSSSFFNEKDSRELLERIIHQYEEVYIMKICVMDQNLN